MKKSEVLDLLRDQPEEMDIARFMYTLYVRRKIELGLADADTGHEISLDEIDEMIKEWPA